jgi:hypothetical protein
MRRCRPCRRDAIEPDVNAAITILLAISPRQLARPVIDRATTRISPAP